MLDNHRKLSVIFHEFGIDKTGDVLDSALAGELFEDVFTSAILNPERIEVVVDQAVSIIHDEIRQTRETSAVYGISDLPDAAAAERLCVHPLPHWVERMTTEYLNAHGGTAVKKRSWWELVWPDGQEQRKCVFAFREADQLTDATLLNLENSRVRGLAMNLPQVVAGQPLPEVSISGLPVEISGLWGLFEIRISTTSTRTAHLRTPAVRRAYVSVFLNEEGKLFRPTARHIWDALQTAEPQVLNTLDHEASLTAHKRLMTAAEQAGHELFDVLRQNHVDSVDREEERGRVAFGARRRAIDRVGLPEVRQYRQARCDAEETEWRKELESARQVLPEIRALLMIRTIKGEANE